MNLIALYRAMLPLGGGVGSKLLKVMKLTAILLVITLTQVSAKVFSQNISLNGKNTSLEKILKSITRQSGYLVLYQDRAMKKANPVTIQENNIPLQQALDHCFSNQPLSYQILEKTIIVSAKQPSNTEGNRLPIVNFLFNVKGKIVDEKGNPLPGATIRVKDTNLSTLTNTDGEFLLSNVPDNAILTISFIGYAIKEMAAKPNLETVQLTLVNAGLNEVIVVGYGSKKKIDLTGTVGSLQSEEITRARATGTQEAMQGRIAGVDIKRGSGKPGSDFNIEIRGANSITGSTQPLYVIDGIPVGQNGSATNPVNDINPADIERIDVLKDASSTAIYGSRGANGVVLVTTKRGTKGNAKITYDGYFGIVNPYHLPPVMDGPTFVAYARDYYNALSNYPQVPIPDDKIFSATELTNIKNGTYTNWVDLIKRNGSQSNHNLSITGGDDKTTYFLSGGYQLYQGTTKAEDSKKYTLKAGLDKTINNTFKVGGSIYSIFVNNHLGSAEVFRSAYRLRPTGSAYNADGTPRFFTYESESQITNPLFEFNNEIRQQQYIHVLPNVYAEANIIKGLKIRTSFSPDLTFQRQGQYDDTFTKQQAGTKPAQGQSSSNQWVNYTWENLLSYNREIGRHKFDVTLGNTFEYHQQDFSSIAVTGLPYRSLWYNLGTFQTVLGQVPIIALGSGYSKQTIASYFGRANYSFNSRYLLTATMRADGNSIFAPGHKWGYFPSGAFAWIVSEEDFLKDFKLINLLKLRLSYGKSGNAALQPNIFYPYVTQSTIYQTSYDFNGVQASGFAPNYGNQNLTWEKTDEYNAGIDLGVLDSRVNLELDLYRKTSKGSILSQPVPPENGYSAQTTNLGSVRNQGIEIGLNTVNVRSKKFSWNTNINFAANYNKILDLYGNGKDDIGAARFIGQKVRVVYNYKIIGVWQTSEAAQAAVYSQVPGTYKIQDVNKNNKIDPADRQVLGSDIPNWFGGLTNTMNYANFDFSFTVYTRQGTLENSEFLNQALNGDQRRARFGAFDRSYWTPTNPSNTWANTALETQYGGIAILQNTSYTKISNITLGYTVPKRLLSRVKISNLRVYANAFNPFIFSKFIGWDPENPSNTSSLNQDFRTRTFMLGLNLTL